MKKRETRLLFPFTKCWGREGSQNLTATSLYQEIQLPHGASFEPLYGLYFLRTSYNKSVTS